MEGLKRVYEEELSKKDKQLRYLENELNHRTQVFEAEKRRIDSEHELQH